MAFRRTANQSTSEVAPISPRMAAMTKGLMSPLSLMKRRPVAHSIEQTSRFDTRKTCVGSGIFGNGDAIYG